MVAERYSIMIVVGEASGDAHASKLVKALREYAPGTNFEFYGATGHLLREAGVETVLKADNLSVIGLPEILQALPLFWKTFQILKNQAFKRKPDVVILVDFPDFNLRLAKVLRKQNLKVIYYISPQLWAWRKRRAKIIKKSVDLLLTILPFEKIWYEERGITHIEYVGNPLTNEVFPKQSKEEFCSNYNLDKQKPIIALLPGSRKKELSWILPVMLETAGFMSAKNVEIQFVIALAKNRKVSEVEKEIKSAKQKGFILPENLIIVENQTYDVLHAADAAAVTSGTATLETGIIGTPLTIVYKTSRLNYKLIRPLIEVPHFGLINLIANERLAKELIQNEFTKESLADELFRLLEPEENRKMRGKLKIAVEKLGSSGASIRAAKAVLNFLKKEKVKREIKNKAQI